MAWYIVKLIETTTVRVWGETRTRAGEMGFKDLTMNEHVPETVRVTVTKDPVQGPPPEPGYGEEEEDENDA